MHCLPIFMDAELNHFYYNGYCKSILSPMLHVKQFDFFVAEAESVCNARPRRF